MSASVKPFCWIHPHPHLQWAPGRVLRREAGVFVVQDEDDEEFKVKEEEAQFVEEASLSRRHLTL